MTWVKVGVAFVGGGKGAIDANTARKKQEKHDAFRKQAMIYSPWTKMGDVGPGNFGNTNAISGALGGGMQGAALGSMMSGGIGDGAAKTAAPTVGSLSNASYLGGNEMAAKLGETGADAMAEARQVAGMNQGLNSSAFANSPQAQGLMMPERPANRWAGLLGANTQF